MVYCHAYELKQLLKSSRVHKVGSGEDDVLNCWGKKMTGNEKYVTLRMMEVTERD